MKNPHYFKFKFDQQISSAAMEVRIPSSLVWPIGCGKSAYRVIRVLVEMNLDCLVFDRASYKNLTIHVTRHSNFLSILTYVVAGVRGPPTSG